jgi:hypothetical protein
MQRALEDSSVGLASLLHETTIYSVFFRCMLVCRADVGVVACFTNII